MKSFDPAIERACKDVFDKVIMVNAVKEDVDEMMDNIDFVTDPSAGLFNGKERDEMTSVVSIFSRQVDNMLGRKFNEVGLMLDECIKKEMIKGSEPSSLIT